MTVSAKSSTRRRIGAIVQIAGFVVGIALLGWCVSLALSPENRAELGKLTEATPWQIVGLLALGVVSVALNGANFWVILRPVKRLALADVIATNALATFAGYLPFKLSLAVRAVVHNRRDGVPLLTIGAWLAAMAATFFATLGPILAISFWRQGVDAAWWAGVIASVALGATCVLILARIFRGERGTARIHALTDRAPIGILRRGVRSARFRELHAGFEMLSCPTAVYGSACLRLLDLGTIAGRFLIGAAVLGVPLGWQDGALMAATFFFIGAASPFGVLGTREAATIAVASAFGIAAGREESLATIVLFVAGAESVVNIGGAAFGVAWLRADRLLRGVPTRPQDAQTDASEPHPSERADG